MKKIKKQQGFSLFEILIVMVLFVVIIVVVNQAFFAVFKGQSKSEATTKVKQNANFVLSTMQKSLHSAQSVSACTASTINYYDADGKSQTFSCESGLVKQSGSALSTSDIVVSSCNFTCTQEGGKKTVTLNMTFDQAGSENLKVEEKATYKVGTLIRLRN